ncbi:MAG: vesicle formation at the endoplasmic reticulum [Bogoriella megaspora]|nr:MAG: vesicle formation at the endoplasmic reticulum [Bogoriella megaspora]
MRGCAFSAGLACLAGSALARSTANIKPFETVPSVPEGWERVGTPSPSEPLKLRIAVKSPNNAMLDQRLLDISTPGHSLYGQHLSRDELKALLRPAPDVTDMVMEWLDSCGIERHNIEDDGEWVAFHTNVTMAEQLMGNEFGIYRNLDAEVDQIRTLSYSVPDHLHPHIDFVQPTTRFGQPKPFHSTLKSVKIVEENIDAVPASCNSQITPACLKSLYNVPDTVASGSGNKIGFGGFLEQYARYADYNTFIRQYATYVKNNFTYTLFNGGLNDQNSAADATEANLDVQYGLALGFTASGIYYSTAGRGPLVPDLNEPTTNSNEPWLEYVTGLKNTADAALPQTISNSYGEDEQSLPANYTSRVCTEFRDLGLRGVSVLFSSGDSGPGSGCQLNDGSRKSRFLPTFPGACPYITSVGGTRNVPEVAVEFSSGGFSERFARPSYQNSAVSSYLTKVGNNFTGFFNPQGRGFPDVAAEGQSFIVQNKGTRISVGGTSASSPTFAGIISLINGARLAAGSPPLGFLNPWLYDAGTASGFNDITTGRSTGCTNTPVIRGASWNATAGWDAVTGLGTPNFPNLLASGLRFSPTTKKMRRGAREILD